MLALPFFLFFMLLQITVVEDYIHKVETKFNILSCKKKLCKILIADIHKNFHSNVIFL